MVSKKQSAPRAADADRPQSDPPRRAGYDDWEFTSNAEKEFGKFPDVVQGNFLDLIERVLDRETRAGAGDVKSLDSNIFELRDRYKNNHYRVLWFVSGRECVAVTCFYKNQQKTEKKDLDRANARRKAYLQGR